MGTQYIDVVLFALVAVFLGLRLRSVLGRRSGNEKPPPEQGSRQDWRGGMGQPRPPGSGQVIDIRPGVSRPQITNQPPGVAAIMEADPAFSPEAFLAGARGAFEMILRAFAEGDEATLRGLLETQVFESFSGAIRARKEAGEICANTLDAVEHAEIAEAGLISTAQVPNSQARITVRIASKQHHATRDAEGKVIDGDPDHQLELVDLWTFTRDLRSRDPNWHLAATSTPEE